MLLPSEIIKKFNLQHYGDIRGLEEDILNRVLNIGSSYFLCHQKILLAFLKKHNKLKTDLHIKYGVFLKKITKIFLFLKVFPQFFVMEIFGLIIYFSQTKMKNFLLF